MMSTPLCLPENVNLSLKASQSVSCGGSQNAPPKESYLEFSNSLGEN